MNTIGNTIVESKYIKFLFLVEENGFLNRNIMSIKYQIFSIIPIICGTYNITIFAIQNILQLL